MKNKFKLYFDPYILTIFLLAIALFTLISKVDISRFSPDSWMFYAGSKNLGNYNFYYLLDGFHGKREFGTSHPFGFSTLIGVVAWIFGDAPINMPYINLIIHILSLIIICNILRKYQVNKLLTIVLLISFTIYPEYLDEIIGGRSIPFAILLFLIAILFLKRNAFLLAGFFWGLAANVRFDFLAFGLISIAFISIHPLRTQLFIKVIGGFLIGLLPWVIYSHYHFDMFWASNNGWVALSAQKMGAGDFPFYSEITVYDNPKLWLERIFFNIPQLLNNFLMGVLSFPAAIIALIIFTTNFNLTSIHKLGNFYKLLLWSIISMTPYLLTGYFDLRYFSLILLVISSYTFIKFREYRNYILITTIFTISTLINVQFYRPIIDSYNTGKDLVSTQKIIIQNLSNINASDDNTLLFLKDISLSSKFRAITEKKSAVLPLNWNTMNDSERSAYLSSITPYIMVDY